jgi:prepilin-type N-terminal cleavage/methylation domain-containing protein
MEGQRFLKDTSYKISNFIPKKSGQVSKKGFTLLEIMIALAIIGLTLVTVLHTVNYHSNVSYENIVTTHMVQSAKEKISLMETNQVNSKGNIEGTDLAFENIVSATDDPGIIELKTVVKGRGKEVVLNELVKKDFQ